MGRPRVNSDRESGDGPHTVVVISETDRRDVRLEKQLRALVTLGHKVHLIAPGGAAGQFAAAHVEADGGPDEVYGMHIPAGESPAATSGSPIRRWVPAHIRRLGASVLNAANGARRRRDRRRRLHRVVDLLPALEPDLLILHRDYVAAELLGRRLVDGPAVVDLHEIPRVMHGKRFAPPAGMSRRHRERRRLLEGLRRARVVTSEELITQHLAAEFGLPVVELPSVVLEREGGTGAGPEIGDVASLRNRLGLTDEERLIVYLGFYRPMRGVERLIEAIRHLPDHYHLALVVGWTGRELRAALADHPEGQRIHLLDLVGQDELIPFLRGSDLGVYVPDDPGTPHEHLCMPTKLYEFHAAEVPVLVADDPGLREFTARYGGTVVLRRPVDPHAIATAIADTVEGRTPATPRRSTPDLVTVMRDVVASALDGT